MIHKIRNEKQYRQVMDLIEGYLQKATDGGGFHVLNDVQAGELEKLSLLAERYEDETMYLISGQITPPTMTFKGLIEARKEQLGVTQKGLAALLGIGESKLSQILNGKREPDVPFLKSLHEKLGIDGNFLLERF